MHVLYSYTEFTRKFHFLKCKISGLKKSQVSQKINEDIKLKKLQIIKLSCS
jgi:hypothetical protein